MCLSVILSRRRGDFPACIKGHMTRRRGLHPGAGRCASRGRVSVSGEGRGLRLHAGGEGSTSWGGGLYPGEVGSASRGWGACIQGEGLLPWGAGLHPGGGVCFHGVEGLQFMFKSCDAKKKQDMVGCMQFGKLCTELDTNLPIEREEASLFRLLNFWFTLSTLTLKSHTKDQVILQWYR